MGKKKIKEQRLNINQIEEIKTRSCTDSKSTQYIRIGKFVLGKNITSSSELFIKSDFDQVVVRGLNSENSEYLVNGLLSQIYSTT